MRTLAVIGFGFLWATAALSQPAPPTAAPPPRPSETIDADTLAAARDLMREMNVESMMTGVGLIAADAAVQTEVEALRKQGIDLPSDLVEQIRQLVQDETRSSLEEMTKTFKEDASYVYARYFTAPELCKLKELQSDPVMRKLQTLTPQLMAELVKIDMDKAAETQAQLMRKVQALIESWNKDREAARDPSS